MGFAVTASHLIFAVALLSAGSFAAASYWKTNEDLERARQAEARLAEQLAHTSIRIVGAPSHSAAAQTLEFNVTNAGTTVLTISEFAYLVDGSIVLTPAPGYPAVAGASATDLLLPGDTMTVRLDNVATPPTRIAAVAGNGVAAYWSA